MKKILLFTCIFCVLSTANTHAQTRKNTKHTKPVEQTSDALETPKTIDDATKGVMGQDTLQQNKKGLRRNLNTNTGVPLPPSTGTNSNKVE